MLKALVFDFDGLIVDTETPCYLAWQEIYREYGQDLPLALWVKCIGSGHDEFDPYDYLEERLSRTVDREGIRARHTRRFVELTKAQSALPGVAAYLADARALGLKLAVASSSPRTWVAGNLEHLGLLGAFDTLVCLEDAKHVKPQPDLYLTALARLGAAASEAAAFEDSLNGLLAAQRAGIFCVVVPNDLTRDLALDKADLRLDSLAEMPLGELATLIGRRRGWAAG